MWAILTLVVLPVCLAWFSLLALPIVVPPALIAGALAYLSYKLYRVIFAVRVEAGRLRGMLMSHLKQFEDPIKACSCVFVKDGRTFLATQFKAGGNSWSFRTEGDSLRDAVNRVHGKLLYGGGCPPSCGNRPCANWANCPNTKVGSPYKELVSVRI